MDISTLYALLMGDFLALRTWFYTRRFSKLLIIFSFITLVLGVVWGIYSISRSYFLYMSSYGTYGLLSVAYVINASIVVVSALMIMAAVAALVGFLLEKTPEHEYLLSQPISPIILPTLYFIRSFIVNIFFISLIFVPIALAYQTVFLKEADLFFYLRIVYILGLLVFITNSIAVFISYGIAHQLKKRTPYTGAIGLFLFFLIMFCIFFAIFPNTLLKMSDSQSIDFLQEFSRLPINAEWLPTVWVTSTLLKVSFLEPFLLFLLTLLLLITSYRFQKKYFILLYHHIHPQEHSKSSIHSVSRFFMWRPFLIKDYLSIVREPAEIGYVYFLVGIAIFFFIFLRIGINKGLQASVGIQAYLAVFTFLWLGFFITAFLLRIVYPLMAREGINRWFLFTLPLNRSVILTQKIQFGSIVSLPLSVFSIIVWIFLPFSRSKYSLIFFSLIMVTTLTLIHTLMGSINPDYENGENPEKTSTTAMGILTLCISFLYISISSYLIFHSLQNPIDFLRDVFTFIAFTVGILVLIIAIAFYNQKNY